MVASKKVATIVQKEANYERVNYEKRARVHVVDHEAKADS